MSARKVREPSPWALECKTDGKVYLTQKEYLAQLCNGVLPWMCPTCGQEATYDETNYLTYIEKHEMDI